MTRAIKRHWRCPYAVVPGSRRFLRPGNARVAVLGKSQGPSLDLNFVNGRPIDSRLTYTGGGGTSFNAAGSIVAATTNVPRIDYGSAAGAVTNQIRNSTMFGAAVGTPGTLPTNWAVKTANGLTTNVSAIGTANGIPYIDVQITGTPSGAFYDLSLDGIGGFTTVTNASYTYSYYSALAGGGLTNVNVGAGGVQGCVVGAGGANFTASLSGTLTRGSITVNVAGTNLNPTLRIATTAGQAIDVTIRIGAPQFETGSIANPWVPTSGTASNLVWTPKGLLIEEARTNGAIQSGAMATYTAANGSLTAAAATAPDGTLAAAFFKEDASTGAHTIALPFTVVAATQYAVSFFLKAGTRRYMMFTGAGLAGAGLFPQWDAVAGTDITTGSAAGFTHGIQAVGGGWYRCWFVFTTGSTTGFSFQMASAPGVNSYTGDNVSGLYLWGMQIEAGAFATSYVPTTSAAATRAADVATIPVSGGWFNPAAGTVSVEAIVNAQHPTATQTFYQIDDGTQANRNLIRAGVGTTNVSSIVVVASASVFNQIIGSLVFGARTVAALTYAGGSQMTALNGAAGPSGTAPTINPGATELVIGNSAGLAQINGYIRRVRYWPRAMPALDLQRITT